MLTIPGEDALILTAHCALVVQRREVLGQSVYRRPGSRHRDRCLRLGAGIRQCLRLDLSFAWDNRPAAAGDDLTLALDYASVSARIQAFAEQAQFQLVETFAERLVEVLMSEFKIPGCA
jgi:hypothetical protein